MKEGKIFQRDGAFWMVLKVTPESNATFCWLKVEAAWSQFGPQPLWPNESRTFLMQRERRDRSN